MPAIIPMLFGALKTVLFKVVIEQMLMSLVKSQRFAKKLADMALEKLVGMTETKADDKLLEAARKEWKLQEDESE